MTNDQGYIQRRFQRIDTQLQARVAALGVRYDGRILNVSTGGCLIEGPIQARVGQIFAVGYPKQTTWEIFRCKIMWATTRGDAFQFGNVFLVMDEKAKHLLMLNLIEAAGVDLP
jgi:PilZ domain